MPTRPRPKFNLRFLLLALAFCSSIVTLVNTFCVMFSTQKQEMIDHALDVNKAYALRIATGVENVLSSNIDRLKYGSRTIGAVFSERHQLIAEAKRLLEQDNSFNSVLIANADGIVVASAPEDLRLDGKALQSREPIERREPMISEAFQSLAGNLVVFISHPVFDEKGNYLGLIGGSIRLEQKSTLRALMDLNVRQDGAYVYLVDSHRRVLYHPDPEQIGEIVQADLIVDAALHQDRGSLQATDIHGNEMLAGYAGISSSHWGVVSQQSMGYIQATLEASTIKVAKGLVPLGLFGTLVIWWLGTKISTPLSRLADSAKRLDAPGSYKRIYAIPADYFESWQIRRALLLGARLLAEKIGRLNQEAQSDVLTGLSNRRAMQEKLSLWQETMATLAVISIDIDHFKHVNDTFGHAAGDETLKSIANLMRQNSRPGDLLCRAGGEEFVLLLPNSSIAVATEIAERLRASIEAAPLETVGHITVSLGVALWRAGEAVSDALEKADQLLYKAKQQGRNRVISQERSDAFV